MYVSNTPLFCRYFTSTKNHGFFYQRSFLLNQDYVELIVTWHLFRMKVVYCIKFFSWEEKNMHWTCFYKYFLRGFRGGGWLFNFRDTGFCPLVFSIFFLWLKDREREPKENFLKTHLHKSAEYFFFNLKWK